MSFQPRFENGIYRDCKWCGGKGCLQCPNEADKEYKRQFPDGPQPIMTITKEEMEHADVTEAMGGETIEDTHGIIGRIAQFAWDETRKPEDAQ